MNEPFFTSCMDYAALSLHPWRPAYFNQLCCRNRSLQVIGWLVTPTVIGQCGCSMGCYENALSDFPMDVVGWVGLRARLPSLVAAAPGLIFAGVA